MTAEEILREEFYNKPSVESCFARTIGITYSSGEIDQSEIFSKDEMIAFAEHFRKESSKELVEAFLEVFDKASCIQHWHDTLYNKEVNECEGMVVSAKKVRELWAVLEKHRELRHSKALENHLK